MNIDPSSSALLPLLNMELLSAFEERLRSQGLPVDEWARPGLKIDEMEELLAPLGLTLPVEVSIWWQWHDGATRPGRERVFGPKELLSLGEAVDAYRQLRLIADDTAAVWPEGDSDYLWDPAWLPIKGLQLPIVVDCSVPDGQPTPMRFIDWQDLDGFSEPRAGSFGQMVSWWVEAIDCGAWRWNSERNQWDRHDEALEWRLRTNPLV
jgi:cell wall assembly regulator SMI1